MSIDFYYSSSIEILFDKLAENINDCNDDPFYSPIIFIPNPNVKKWLQFNIARKNQICANINCKYLEEGLTSIVKLLDRDKCCNDYIFIGHEENYIYFQLLITSIIMNNMDNNDFSDIKEYIYNKNFNESYHIKKIWELSEKLGFYFREYEFNRSEMIENWKSPDYKEKIKLEKFQRIIYNKIFFENTLKEEFKNKTGKEYITLPQYSKLILNAKANKNIDDTFHIFSFSQVSRFHYELITQLSEYCNFKIYYINYFSGNNILSLTNDYFASWLKAAKENITNFFNLLNKKEQTNHKIYQLKNPLIAAANENPSLLNLIQNNIMNNINNQAEVKDKSIQIISAPTAYREIEIIYNSIIHNLTSDSNIKLTDIAVLAPDISKYKSIIKNVFSKDPATDFKLKIHESNEPFVPYNLSDSTAKDDSVLGNALLTALNLSKTNYSRNNVFELLINPCFLESQKITYDEALIWLNWIDKLNIYHDYDLNNGDNNYSWSFNLKRLRLGRIIKDYSFNGDLKKYLKLIPFQDKGTDDDRLLNTFISAIEKLFDYMNKFQKNNSAKKWIEILNDFLNDFLKIPDDMEEENSILYNLLENINKLELFDKLLIDKINLEFIIGFIKMNLKGIKTKIGKYLADGITISSLVPMRPIPFKIIYIIGMNEDDFPGKPDRSTLDLRNLNEYKNTGDVNKQETNLYLFFEILMSVKEKLYITYTGKDLEKDKILYPSGVCNKLINYINDVIFINQDDKFKIIEAPLKQESIKYLTKNPDYQDVLYNYSYEDTLLSLQYLKSKINLDKKILIEIDNKFGLTQNVITEKVDEVIKENTINQISVTNLADFIKNPVNIILKKHFDLYLNDEDDSNDLMIKDYEPLYSVYPYDYNLIVNTLKDNIQNHRESNKQDIKKYYNDYYEYNKLSGNLPSEVFAEIDNEKIFNKIEFIFNKLSPVLNELKNFYFYKKIILNDLVYAINENQLVLPAIKILINENPMEITGEMENVFLNKEKSEIIFIIVTNAKNKPLTHHIIKPFVLYLFLLTDKDYANLSCEIKIFYKDEVVNHKLKIDKAEAKLYIEELLSDYIKGDLDLIPFDLIVEGKTFFPLKEKESYQPDYKTLLEFKIEEEDYAKKFKPLKLKIPDNVYDIIKFRYKYFNLLLNGNKDFADE